MTPNKNTMSDLHSHLGYWMRMVSNRVSLAFAQKLEGKGVTVAEWVVLREMYSRNDTTSPSAIADLTGLTRGAVSKLIDRLLRKKLVHRREAIDDRRFQEIELSNKARLLLPQLAGLADENDEEFFSALSEKERAGLDRTLKKLAQFHQIKKVPIE
jgi:DNA-binding MarR family transcriptional regulator